jgi:hypothetical protein
LNQTTMMHKIGAELSRRHECACPPFYAAGPLRHLKPLGLLDHTILAGRFRRTTEEYLRDHGLTVDDRGRRGGYDLALTCSDLVVPKSLRRQPLVLVQEGMTDSERKEAGEKSVERLAGQRRGDRQASAAVLGHEVDPSSVPSVTASCASSPSSPQTMPGAPP